MYDTLFVEVEEAVEDLRHVQGDEVLGEFSKVLADAVQRSVFAVPGWVSYALDVYYGPTHSRIM
jgi:hypothetical protein